MTKTEQQQTEWAKAAATAVDEGKRLRVYNVLAGNERYVISEHDALSADLEVDYSRNYRDYQEILVAVFSEKAIAWRNRYERVVLKLQSSEVDQFNWTTIAEC